MASEPLEEPAPAATIADFETEAGEPRRLSTIGRYVILDSIGMGGMGLVCAAYDPKLDRKIALKLLRTASTGEASTAGRNRLFREAQALARLSHPNVVTVHDVDVYEGQVYIAMEFVEGTNLRDWVKDGQRSWEEVLAKFIPAGEGLAAAHTAGIIHRDFKPANILLSNDGDVRVADFGVAKERTKGERAERLELEVLRNQKPLGDMSDATSEDALISEIQSSASRDLTVAGRMVGTPAYMAPEQHMGLRVGPFTDQYSFCVSLYEALYGRLPFEGTDRRDQLTKMTEGRLRPPPKEGPARHVPSWVHKVLARGLNPHPSERWPSMEALLSALQRDPIRRLWRAGAGAVGIIGVTAGVLGWLLGGSVIEEPADMCEDVGAKIHERWGDQQREALRAAFGRSSKPFAADAADRVIRFFNHWSEGWEQQSVEICQHAQAVGGEQQAMLAEERMRCLDQRLQDFEALVELFSEADDQIVEGSVGVAHDLPDPDDCATVTASQTSEDLDLTPEQRELLEAMDADLDRAQALAALGKFDTSLPLAKAVVANARELEHESTLVRGLYDLAQSQAETNDPDGAEASLREAVVLAAKRGDARHEAKLWARMIHYVGHKQNRRSEGRAWALAAEGALARAGEPPELTARFESAMGSLLYGDGKYEEALAHYRQGLELAERALGTDNELTLTLMSNLGIALAVVEKFDEATEVLELAVERNLNFYGPSHPKVASVYASLGNVRSLVNDVDGAVAALESALEIRKQVFGPDSTQVASVELTLANIASTAKRGVEEALERSERAAATFLVHRGESSVEYAVAMTNVGWANAVLGRYDDARVAYAKVLAIYDVLYEGPHPSRANLNKRRCRMLVQAQSWAEGVVACEHALDEGRSVGASMGDAFEADILEMLVTLERGRGREQSALRYQARLDELKLPPEEDAG
ncbi:serine/threonine kinase family protein [Plesiocystis pacifica SIR-1]|uniref:Serine/threonine kinase family protein n=1 Tax=Plesiocystis pacifica SIR-1 TaxID=391625 RepID=A6GF00_9BACT|nr:serine/threonine-protein kinase [Plesiocystis pacifica]EDM75527.1 serine/threonine kinase family protein [Plesiocystis pacifica SIR-1]